jgi:hypothetical protein
VTDEWVPCPLSRTFDGGSGTRIAYLGERIRCRHLDYCALIVECVDERGYRFSCTDVCQPTYRMELDPIVIRLLERPDEDRDHRRTGVGTQAAHRKQAHLVVLVVLGQMGHRFRRSGIVKPTQGLDDPPA